MKRLTLLLAAALLLCLPAAAEGWSFGDSWEEAPSAYAGEWDADSAPAAPADEGTRNDAPAQDAGWEASSSATTMYVVNCSEYVNLRAAPDTASQSLAHVPLGAQVLAYGGEGDFYRVEYAGMRGYVHADYLSTEPAPFSMRLAGDPGYARLDTAAIEAYASSEQVDQ